MKILPHINNQVAHDLIIADLKKTKLYKELLEAGFDTSRFKISLDKSIFDLLELNSNLDVTKIKEWYHKTLEEIYSLDLVNQSREIELLAVRIFNYLKVSS